MPTTLSLHQLNAALTSEQIGKARSERLLPPPESGPLPPDPVEEAIAAACAKVDTYCHGWLVADVLRTALARDLAAWEVAKRLGKPTDEQATARERALKELEDIRDGKFPGIARDPASAPAAPAAKIKGGSKPKI